jgi:single-stranded-DNA-specific exonuclease
MLSVSGNQWAEISVNKRILEKYKIDYNLQDLLAKLIIHRNFTIEEISSIDNKIILTNPFLNCKDFLNSGKILKKNIDKDNKILIIGDYDVDGCVSTSLMVNFFNFLQVNYKFHIPSRTNDGYGSNLNSLKKLLKDDQIDLVIMLDCGSNSHEMINHLNIKKIDSIIIDHHNIYNPYPNSTVIINPKKECEYQKYNYLCASYLTYFFLDSFIKDYNIEYNLNEDKIYVLLATVADVMPLRYLNRILAIEVLDNFNPVNNLFIRNFFEEKKINRKLTINDLAFFIGPILNAAGRIDDANKVVKLITTKDKKIRKELTKNLFSLNNKRQLIESNLLNEIDIENQITKKNEIIIIYEKNCPEGIMGIIAARIKEITNKPCIILNLKNDIYKGSCRSTSNFNIGEYVQKGIQNKIIDQGGGHNLAAGLNIKKRNLLKFKKYINQIYSKKINEFKIKKYYLSKISLNAVSKVFFNEISKAGPFGNENYDPIFLIENVKVLKPLILKKKYVTCYISINKSKLVKAISFNNLKSNISKNLLFNKKNIDILTKIVANNWNNKKLLQLEIIDVILKTNKA